MFPFSTCMCFRQQKLTWAVVPQRTTNQKSEAVTIDTTGQNAIYIRMLGPADLPAAECRLSAEDWMLLDAQGPRGTSCTGRFLTMHKRRRKRLTTRNLQQEHSAILDDVHHGQVQCILDRCGQWAFNAFALETCAGGRSLPVLCVHLFHWYGLLDHFRLDVVRVWKLFTLIEEGYHSTNPYHNSIHATDVTQAMHCFLQEEKIRKHLNPLEIMAALIGAVAHDLDHPGVNQHFLISTSNHLAALYENSSVLENHHWRSAVGCLLESGVAEQLTHCRAELEEQIRSLILATDITRQQEFISKFRKDLEDGSLELKRFQDRHFILQIALKCADISNPTRPWDISHKWSLKVCQEFFRQGDYERKLNLPVTSLCDRQSTSVPKIQSGFFRFVVTPLFSEWHRFLSSELSTHMMNLLTDNQKRWEKLEADEQAEETQTELSDAEPEEISEADEETRGSSETLLLPVDFIPRRQSLAVPQTESLLSTRRHSMPVNTGPILPRTIIRRESLPMPNRYTTPEVRVSNSRASSSHIREEDELQFGSQTSLLSSNSGGRPHSSEDTQERPLSAETLLPEPSITSMTSCAAAERISSIIHGGNVAPATKCLTRQQTFPPLQPYVRMRYMSTTAEMTSCTEALIEGGSKSNSSHSSMEHLEKTSIIPTIIILSPNNCRDTDVQTDPPNKIISSCNKREPEALEKEKASKMPKLSDSGQRYEKENVDPRKFMPPVQGLNIRRGSAPVTMSLVRPEENAPSAGGVLRTVERLPRRGSMPIDVSQQVSPEKDKNHQGCQDTTALSSSNIVPSHVEAYLLRQCPRRGSAPADSPLTLTMPVAGERRDLLTRHTSLNGKASRRKKQLRRRSSGGPETVCAQEALGQDVWHRLRRDLSRRSENPDLLLARRRGSLPIEMLTVGHSVC